MAGLRPPAASGEAAAVAVLAPAAPVPEQAYEGPRPGPHPPAAPGRFAEAAVALAAPVPGDARWSVRLPAAVPEARTEEVVYGMPLRRNVVLARAVQRVVLMSALGGTYWICIFIWHLLTGTYGTASDGATTNALWSGFSQLIIELSIPACGYYGAMYAYQTLVFFFCGLNAVFVMAAVIQLLRLVMHLGRGSGDCETRGYFDGRSDCQIDWGHVSAAAPAALSLVLLMLLGFFSFAAGKHLYQGLGPLVFGREPMASPVRGEVLNRLQASVPLGHGPVVVRVPWAPRASLAPTPSARGDPAATRG